MSDNLDHIKDVLIKMGKMDQKMRNEAKNNKDKWNPDIDKENTKVLKEIVEKIGWPTLSKVGEDANFYAWLIIQHADEDLDFQQLCLAIMKKTSKSNETDIPMWHIAYLEDRILCKLTNTQLYGTQFQITPDGRRLPFTIIDKEKVNEKRQEVGLEPLGKDVLNIDLKGFEVKWSK